MPFHVQRVREPHTHTTENDPEKMARYFYHKCYHFAIGSIFGWLLPGAWRHKNCCTFLGCNGGSTNYPHRAGARQPLTQASLATELAPFKIHPTLLRIANRRAKGYLAADFAQPPK
jgi:hypothetical protein